ncbi:MAG: hypothetical protein ACE5FU_06990, partial [Nitrospinota bacterium]
MILTVLKKSEPRLVYMVLISTFSLLLLSGWLYLLKKPVKEYLQLKQNRSLLQNRVEPDFLVEEKLENMKKS